MNPLAMVMVLASCFMHAGWNILLARRGRSETELIRQMLRGVVLAGFIPACVSEYVTGSMGAKSWLCVGGSGICCGVYFLGLARSYGSSDFTIVYPVVRSLPVLLVAVGDVMRGRAVTPAGWFGMFLVVLGCSLSPHSSFRTIRVRSYLNPALLWMALTAMGTVGYTLLDKIASEAVKAGPATAARYCYFFFFFTYIVYAVLTKFRRTGGTNSSRIGWRPVVLIALLNFGAYWLVLWAYQLGQRAGYIVAFRQFGIVIGVLIAIICGYEKPLAVRVTGTVAIFAGLLLISLWGG